MIKIKGKEIFKGSKKKLGGTMRLGLYDAILKSNSLISKIYSMKKIKERHRYRYEVNIKYKEDFEKRGLILSALSPNGMLPVLIELKIVAKALETFEGIEITSLETKGLGERINKA